MSALPPKADIRRLGRDVRFVPQADIRCCLFDHFICEREQPSRHFKTNSLRGFEIDHQLKFGRDGTRAPIEMLKFTLVAAGIFSCLIAVAI